MKTIIKSTVFLFVFFLISQQALMGQSINSISPKAGSVGTILNISGFDFGEKKGKVKLVVTYTNKRGKTKTKKIKTKVTEWTTSLIQTEISKLITTGSYSVVVYIKGKEKVALVASNAFVALPPKLAIANNIDASSPNLTTIAGSFFGTRKGKVELVYKNSKGKIKRKKLKIKKWGMDVNSGNSRIVAELPKKLPDSIQTIRIRNKYSSDSNDYPLEMALLGSLTLSSDIAYKNEAKNIIANVAVNYNTFAFDSVKLFKSLGGTVESFTMTDDGNLTNGDEIDDDQVYSSLFKLDESEEAAIKFFTLAKFSVNDEKFEFYSETNTIFITEHISDLQLNEILTKQESWQKELDNAGSDSTAIANALSSIMSDLSTDSSVQQYGKSESGYGIWVLYKSGVLGCIDVKESGQKGATRNAPQSLSASILKSLFIPRPYNAYSPYLKSLHLQSYKTDNVAADSENKIKSNKIKAIAAQYWDWGENDDIPKIVTNLNEMCYDVEYTTYKSNGSGSDEDFKNLGSYGVVLISSHGDSLFKFLDWEIFGWNQILGQVVLHSNMKVTTANKATYEDDLKKGRLVIWYGSYGITPSFIEKYSGSMPNSLVYMSICRGTWNGTMANAFINKGAAAFLGYSDYVAVSFCVNTGVSFFDKMLQNGNTIAEAFTPGLKETDDDPAEFILYGAKDLSILVSGILDAGFENGNVNQAWSVTGDGRVLTALGYSSPTENNFMGIVSTGLGFADSAGSIQQTFCMGTNTQISFDWNFFSEEFLEYVGSIYQDSFIVTLSEKNNPGNTLTLVSETIDSLAGQVHKVDNSFDQGDVYATGWETTTTTIPESFQNKKVILKFYTTDVGDSIYDTAVLIDNIIIK